LDCLDCVVVGAGVIGLAVARALARAGLETVIVERHRSFGTETSSRNSEVIHAGIYYPPGSLKARLCVRGRELLYDYCAEHGVPHRRVGKLIVATHESQIGALQRLLAQARANGVDDLRLIDRAVLRAAEPAIAGVAVLESPSTGIVDAHALMLALLGDAEAHGAGIAYRTEIEAACVRPGHIELRLVGEDEPQIAARWLVNCAGLEAPALLGRIEGFPADWRPRARLAKGSYFSLQGRSPFSRLVYPLPEPGGLGIHMTLDLGGRARFGPDVEWVETPDYTVDPGRAARFYDAIRRYWPGLPAGALEPAYAGIRPKISGPGEPAADFRIDGPADHGVPGIVSLLGIESPGLTASLAIAEEVARLVS
jgi:L-2-hydroxyglutarate oxidase LhgO